MQCACSIVFVDSLQRTVLDHRTGTTARHLSCRLVSPRAASLAASLAALSPPRRARWPRSGDLCLEYIYCESSLCKQAPSTVHLLLCICCLSARMVCPAVSRAVLCKGLTLDACTRTRCAHPGHVVPRRPSPPPHASRGSIHLSRQPLDPSLFPGLSRGLPPPFRERTCVIDAGAAQ